MKLKIRELFTNPKVLWATGLSFTFFYFAFPLILVAIATLLLRHFPNVNNANLSILVRTGIYLALIYPTVLMTCLFVVLKTLRTNNVYFISIFTGLVSSALVAGLEFLLFPNNFIRETAGNFLSITALVLVWAILLQTKLSLEKALAYGFFIDVFLHGLVLRWGSSWGKFPGIVSLVLTIVGLLIGSGLATSIFEWIIKKALRFAKIQELNSEEANTPRLSELE